MSLRSDVRTLKLLEREARALLALPDNKLTRRAREIAQRELQFARAALNFYEPTKRKGKVQ